MSRNSLESVRQEIESIANRLPHEVDLFAISDRYKAPGKVAVIRGSFLWRAEELGRNALRALEEENFVTAALVTRALMETAAALVYLHKLVSKALDRGMNAKLDEKLSGLLTGSRAWEEIGGAVHVNDMLRTVHAIIPSFSTAHYAGLSELAHPNWAGAWGAYGIPDYERATSRFARGGRAPETQHGIICGRLEGSISLAVRYYDLLGGMIEPFVKAVTAFYEAENTSEGTKARPA